MSAYYSKIYSMCSLVFTGITYLKVKKLVKLPKF